MPFPLDEEDFNLEEFVEAWLSEPSQEESVWMLSHSEASSILTKELNSTDRRYGWLDDVWCYKLVDNIPRLRDPDRLELFILRWHEAHGFQKALDEGGFGSLHHPFSIISCANEFAVIRFHKFITGKYRSWGPGFSQEERLAYKKRLAAQEVDALDFATGKNYAFHGIEVPSEEVVKPSPKLPTEEFWT